MESPRVVFGRSARARLLAAALIGAESLWSQTQTPTPAPALPADPSRPIALEAIEVTGSRLKRVDYETPAPVVTYTAAAMDEKGYGTLGEFVQSLPFNNSLANSEFTTGSFITGAATINPRGLGSNRVLTLVNGRRTVPYGLTNSASGTPQSVFNFNSIPSSAIDRIEILKDGASALYGSDAISGVYNILLKKEYSGSSVDVSFSNTLKHDSLNRRISVFTGFSNRKWDVSASVSHQARHSNFIQDFGLKTTDYRYLGPKGQNYLSTIHLPSFLFLTAAQATASGLGPAGGYYLIPGGAPTANATRASFTYAGTTVASIPSANRYDPVADTQLYPASETGSAYVNIGYKLRDDVTAFGLFTYNRSRLYYESTPPGFTGTITGYTLAAGNPYNPLGIALTNGATPSFGFRALGFRPRREVANNTATALVGLRGTLGKGWTWESGLSYGRDQATRTNDFIVPDRLRAALAATTRATAFNPFGPSDNPDLISSLYTRSLTTNNTGDALAFDVTFSTRAWTLPLRGAGELGVAGGYEFRESSIETRPDTNDYLGVTGGIPFDGRRDTHSFFAEFSLPVQKWLEVQLAGRHEVYSDFGRTTKPKASAKLRLPRTPILNILLRGSYAESFKAPDLGQLYQKQTRAITSGAFLDPLRPQDPARQMRAILGGNPDLKPEEGKTQYFGVVFEVLAIRGLSLTADYFDIKIDNVISTLTISYLLSPEGRVQFPNAVVRDNRTENPGPIDFFYGISNNLGFQLYRGWDFGARYTLRQARLGTFSLAVDVAHIVKRGTNSGQGGGFSDATGRYFAPEWRTNLSLTWRQRAWGAAVTADIIGKYFNRGFTAVGWGENPYTVLNPSLTYRGFRKTVITVGSSNVLDRRPPANGYVLLGFDDRAYGVGALGRTVYLRIRREF